MSKTRYSLWSDQCREKLFNFASGSGHETEIIDLLKGRLDKQNQYPWQSVNYIESHDDYTFIDRLCNPEEWINGSPPLEIVNRAKLAIGLLLLCPGIPMLASGQDYLRSKSGVRNTYQRADLNALDYEKLSHMEYIHTWTKDFITFRMSELGNLITAKNFLSSEQYEIIKGDKNCFAFIVKEETDDQINKILLILVNGAENENRIELPTYLNELNLQQLLGEKSTSMGIIQAISLQVWGPKI
jgi:pullulanase/glycogen debranching enzyme